MLNSFLKSVFGSHSDTYYVPYLCTLKIVLSVRVLQVNKVKEIFNCLEGLKVDQYVLQGVS